jgi:signal transduction histidine kinase/CheY-like chemotaxis protein
VNSLDILHLEDDPKDADLVQERLEAEGVSCRVTRVETEAEFRAAIERDCHGLVLADYTLPSFDGISALKIAMETCPQVPFIFLSGTLDEDVAIEALKIGATDYVFKTRLSRLVPSVRRALREGQERVERLHAEAALRRSETYLAEAQRLSHIGSFGWDCDSGEIYWTPETFRIFAVEPGTKPTLEMVLERTHPEDRAFVRRVLDLAVEQKKEFDFEHRLLMPDGAVKHIRVVAHLVPGGSEFVGAVTDISDFKRSQEALRTSQAELAHVTRLMTMGELAGSIAHELNQPLSSIVASGSACIRWLAGPTPDLEEARETAARIVRDAMRAGDVIQRIRALTRKATTEKERLDLNSTIQEVLGLAKAEMLKNRVALRTELRDDLPNVLGDRIQLQQLVLNLIMNGIEAMSGVGDRPRELAISTQSGEPDQVLVKVRDSGVGLDPKSSERIFDAFYTTKPAGMGMGLSISRSIVQNHGGRLWAVPNDRGPGTMFQFTVPATAGS